MSGGLYTFDAAHVVSPYFGCYMSAEALAASFSTWPVALKFAVKALVAWSFTFDGSNGSRHLSRDAAMITTSQVMRTGWEVVALSLTAALGLALIPSRDGTAISDRYKQQSSPSMTA
jgi:succinate dehydrogenase/fumarate reductase cytochrome b subunit